MSYYFSPNRGEVKWNRSSFVAFIGQMQPIAHFLSIEEDGQRSAIDRAVMNVDYVMRFEHLEAEFELVCEKIGIAKRCLPRRNRSSVDASAKLYDQDTRDFVSDRFRDEIEYFGYSFAQ